jgi:hypothetical protein
MDTFAMPASLDTGFLIENERSVRKFDSCFQWIPLINAG